VPKRILAFQGVPAPPLLHCSNYLRIPFLEDILAVKHDTLHILLESRQRPHSHTPSDPGTASTTWRPTASRHRPTVRRVWLHVEASSEGCQMSIVCRRHCKQPNPATVNDFPPLYYHAQKQHPSKSRKWMKGNFCLPIDTERVHLAYLQKSKLCLINS
jgi:hypothetical protein